MKADHIVGIMMRLGRLLCFGVIFTSLSPSHGMAVEQLVIAASPSLASPLTELGRLFESSHQHVRVRLYFDSGLDLRRTIAGMENSTKGKYFIGSGPIHLVAPGGDELITRLEQKYYVLPGTRRPYAEERLVMVVPESLVEAPGSFEALSQDATMRIAIGDPDLTVLGQKTKDLLIALGIWEQVQGRLDKASDPRSVVDHIVNGQANAGILLGPEAAKESQRIRVVAVSRREVVAPIVHSMAMERYCPNRELCSEFLDFIRSPDAQAALNRLGYASAMPGGSSGGSP